MCGQRFEMETKRNLTLLAYLLFVFNGMVFIATGVLIESIAKYFHVSEADVGFALFSMSVARTAIFFASGYILSRVSMKRALHLSLVVLFISGVVMFLSRNIMMFDVGCILMGIGSSFTVTVPNFIIVSLYSKEQKFQKLNILNATFAIGGTLSPFIVGSLLQLHVEWKYFLSFVFVASIGFIVWSAFSKFPERENSLNNEVKVGKAWHFSIYLISIAMICYVLSESTFCLWSVSFFQERYHFDIFFAGSLLTLYWLFVAIGRSSVYLLSKKMRLDKYISLMGVLSIVCYGLVFLDHIPLSLICVISLLGLSNSTLYASILSYGTDQLSTPSSTLMTLFIICGSVGGISAPFITSFIESSMGVFYALLSGNIAITILFIAIFITKFDKKNPVVGLEKG